MRFLALGVVAAVGLLFGASGASAFAVSMVARGPVSSLATSDAVTVDVFLDVDGGITFFSVAVVNSNSSALLYDGPASAALEPIAGVPGCFFGECTGAQPSYILYGPGRPATILYALDSPYFLTFPSPPGTEQVNINYVESSLNTTIARATGLYIATLVFHVVADFTSESLSLAFTPSNAIQAGTFITPVTAIGLSAPILVTGAVPEPTTAVLIGLGVVSLALGGRRTISVPGEASR